LNMGFNFGACTEFITHETTIVILCRSAKLVGLSLAALQFKSRALTTQLAENVSSPRTVQIGSWKSACRNHSAGCKCCGTLRK